MSVKLPNTLHCSRTWHHDVYLEMRSNWKGNWKFGELLGILARLARSHFGLIRMWSHTKAWRGILNTKQCQGIDLTPYTFSGWITNESVGKSYILRLFACNMTSCIDCRNDCIATDTNYQNDSCQPSSEATGNRHVQCCTMAFEPSLPNQVSPRR